MAATGAEYVTLEQLKDLVTNMIQPLINEIGALGRDIDSIPKIVPVTCGDYDQTFVRLKLADGFSSSTITMTSGDMMLIVNSKDGTYENGSYLLYTGPGKGLTNSSSTWQKAQLTEYKTSASTVNIPDGVAMLNEIPNDIEGAPASVTAYQLMIKTNGAANPVAGLLISDEKFNSMLDGVDKSFVVMNAVKSSEATPAGIAELSMQAANADGYVTNAILGIDHPNGEPTNDSLTIAAINDGSMVESFTAEDLSNAMKAPVNGTDNRYVLLV